MEQRSFFFLFYFFDSEITNGFKQKNYNIIGMQQQCAQGGTVREGEIEPNKKQKLFRIESVLLCGFDDETACRQTNSRDRQAARAHHSTIFVFSLSKTESTTTTK